MFMWGRRRPRRATALVAALLTVAALAGCTAPPPSPAGLRIVAAFYPYQFVAERVLGTLGTVTNLTRPGAEPHDLELTPRQLAAMVTADLVVYQSGFQPAVDTGVAQADPGRVLDVTSVVPPHEPDEHAGTDPDTDPAGTDRGTNPADDGHDHGSADPHLWLDPTNLEPVAREVANRLAAAAPEHAATFRDNADRLTADLAALDTAFRTGLTGCARTVFVTSHDAFGYLAERYHLEQVGIAGLDPSAEPSPARVAEVHAVVERYGVTTVFFETLASDAVARSLATDLGLATDVLDPLEGLTEASRGGDYLQVMSANLAALRKANQCH